MEGPHKDFFVFLFCKTRSGVFPINSVYVISMEVLSHTFVACCLGPTSCCSCLSINQNLSDNADDKFYFGIICEVSVSRNNCLYKLCGLRFQNTEKVRESSVSERPLANDCRGHTWNKKIFLLLSVISVTFSCKSL